MAATFSKGKGKHGAKETSTESYAKTLERKFVSMVGGTPKWAELRKDGDEDADSDDEFFRVSIFSFEISAAIKFILLLYFLIILVTCYWVPCSREADFDTALRGIANPL